MVYWWVIDSYFNIELIEIRDIDNMISTYGSSGLFGSRVSSKSIGHKTYTGRRMYFLPKPTPIHGLVHKYDFNYSCSRSHFSRLPQVAARKIIYRLSQKVSNAYKIIDPVINRFITNDESSSLHICDHSIVKFGMREKIIGLSKNSRVDSLDRFRILVVDKFKSDICIL